MATVRGIGVAVITSTCGRPWPALSRSASRCSTPNRCCSSITTRPSSANWTCSSSSACVPMTMPGRAGRGVQQRPPPGRRPQRPGEQRDPGRLLGAAQLAGLAERAEQPADRPVVLLGEHLGGGQQHGLPAAVHGLQHGPHRDDRLARAHLALQQPVHRVVEGQLVGDRLRRPAAGPGSARTAARRRTRPAGRRPGAAAAPPSTPAASWRRSASTTWSTNASSHFSRAGGPPGVGPVGRAVDPAQRVGQPGQAVPVPQGRGQRVLGIVKRVQREPHRVGDLPGGDVLAGRVDRDQLGRELGRAGPGARRCPAARTRGGRAAASRKVDTCPENSPRTPGRSSFSRQSWRPRPKKVSDSRPWPSVTTASQDRARPVPHLAHRHRRDLGLHGHVLAVGQRGQVGQLAPGVVPARVVPQQVADRVQVEGRRPAAWPPCRPPPARADRSGSPSRLSPRLISTCPSALCLDSVGRPTVRLAAVSAGRPARANPPRSVILPRLVRARPGPMTYFTIT